MLDPITDEERAELRAGRTIEAIKLIRMRCRTADGELGSLKAAHSLALAHQAADPSLDPGHAQKLADLRRRLNDARFVVLSLEQQIARLEAKQ